MKLSNYSLNYSRAIAAGAMTIEDFLGDLPGARAGGASLHGGDLPDLRPDDAREGAPGAARPGAFAGDVHGLDQLRRDGAEHQADELAKAREAIRAAAFLGAPLLRVFAGFESRR